MTNAFFHIFYFHFALELGTEGKLTAINFSPCCSWGAQKKFLHRAVSHVHLISVSTAKEMHRSGFLADSLPFEILRNVPTRRHGTHHFPWVSLELKESRVWIRVPSVVNITETPISPGHFLGAARRGPCACFLLIPGSVYLTCSKALALPVLLPFQVLI